LLPNRELIWSRKANTVRFKDEGVIPNHAHGPFIFYRGVVALPDGLDPAAITEEPSSRTAGVIPDATESMTTSITTLEFAKFSASQTVRPPSALAVTTAGLRRRRNPPRRDGHQCLFVSSDFLVVGAYPPSGTYDECTKSEDHRKPLKTIPKIGRPREDPVYGAKGPLMSWTSVR
jgi:hypothetical protein